MVGHRVDHPMRDIGCAGEGCRSTKAPAKDLMLQRATLAFSSRLIPLFTQQFEHEMSLGKHVLSPKPLKCELLAKAAEA